MRTFTKRVQEENKAGKVRVIRDSSNADKDYWIPHEEAKRRYEQGTLAIDITNGCYTEQFKKAVKVK